MVKAMNFREYSDNHQCKVCAYARVSTMYGEQLNSFENQVEMYTDKIKSNPDWKFVGVYADPAITGTTDERPEFKRMMQDARKHKFDLILVKSISRFARNTLLTLQSIRELQKLGIRVIFEKEHLDTGNPSSEMMISIMSAFAQEESRNTSERVKKGIRMRAANGKISWTPLYGYKKDGEREFVIVEEEAVAVRRIFDLYEKGALYAQIKTQLAAEGLKAQNGREWSRSRIRIMLSNERYAGHVLTNKQYIENHLTHKQIKNKGEVQQLFIENHHDAIIPPDQFTRVQTILSLRSEGQYPYADFLLCPYCGKSLKRRAGVLCVRDKIWTCEDDRFYIPNDQLDQVVLQAYGAFTGAEVQFEKVDFWWLDQLVSNITFGLHTSRDDQTVTVLWKNGERTTIPSGISMQVLRNKRIGYLKKQQKAHREEKRMA